MIIIVTPDERRLLNAETISAASLILCGSGDGPYTILKDQFGIHDGVTQYRRDAITGLVKAAHDIQQMREDRMLKVVGA